MPTGTDFLGEIAGTKTPAEWDAVVFRYASLGAIPSWLSNRDGWPSITAQITSSDGVTHTLVYQVAPDYFGVGTDDDFVLTPMTPFGAQNIANLYAAILPTRRMASAIFDAATQKLPLSDVKAPPYSIPINQIESPAAIAAARTRDRTQYSAPPAGGIIDGHRKNIVLGPNLDGSRVAIYGGSGGSVDGKFWQPYSTIHSSAYGDYSHGARLVARDMMLDGKPVDATTIFQDPVLCQLVSDQGAFFPYFPNAGTASPGIAPASVDRTGSSSGSSSSTDGSYGALTSDISQPPTDSNPLVKAGLVIGGLGLFYWLFARN